MNKKIPSLGGVTILARKKSLEIIFNGMEYQEF